MSSKKKTKKRLEVEDKKVTELLVDEEFKSSAYSEFEKRTIEVLKEYSEHFPIMTDTTAKKYKDFLEIALKYLK
jgi:hypothetical protein